MAPWQRITLVAAGAGAGIAATFNTPIGGVMFAIELMMPELSARTFLPVALATGTATFIGRSLFRHSSCLRHADEALGVAVARRRSMRFCFMRCSVP